MSTRKTILKRKHRARLFREQCGLCFYCAKPMLLQDGCNLPNAATLDHVIPLSMGGIWSPRHNAVAACLRCNHERGTADGRLFMLRKQGLAS